MGETGGVERRIVLLRCGCRYGEAQGHARIAERVGLFTHPSYSKSRLIANGERVVALGEARQLIDEALGPKDEKPAAPPPSLHV